MSRLSVALAVCGLVGAALVVQQSGVAAPTAIDGPATALRPAVRRPGADDGRSLRFFGTGRDDVDRVKIPLGVGTRVNVGATDLTIEFWLRGAAAQNTGGPCTTGDAGWITGNVVIDRDVYGSGDLGDFGVSLAGGRVAWGASVGGAGATVCTTAGVLDGAWHHIAVTRAAATGRLQVWIDGALAGTTTGPPGDASYRVGRTTSWPQSDPFLVLGAEKHDAGATYPSFTGQLDDLRISTIVRYTAPFPRPSSPHAVDAATAALYRFDEGSGVTVGDLVGTSPGALRVGGAAAGPQWSSDTPFAR